MAMTRTQILQQQRATTAAQRKTAMDANPLLNKSIVPQAPSGSHYTWVGGADTGSWKLSKNATTAPAQNTANTSQIASLQAQLNSVTSAQSTASALAAADKFAKRESAISVMTTRLKQYRLESLIPVMVGLAQEDASEDTVFLKLQESDAYQQRFKANKTRISNNLAVLSPKEYLATEDAHRQVLRASGQGRFDNDEYVSQFLENDLAPNELAGRIDLVINRVENADPSTKTQLRALGISDSDMVGYFLDPKKVLPTLERTVATAEIMGAGAKQKFNISAQTAGDLAAKGVNKAQAESGYSAIAGILPDAQRLSDIYGATQDRYDITTGEQEVFGQLASAKRARENLLRSEQNLFSARTGNTGGSNSTAGQL